MRYGCSQHKGSCHGGNPAKAWTWNKANNGSCTESAYPYDAHHEEHNNTCANWTQQRSLTLLPSGMKCDPVSNSIVGKISAVTKGSAFLKAAVLQQPITVGVDAAAKNFHLYKSGIMTGQCGTHLDHGLWSSFSCVLMVLWCCSCSGCRIWL